MIEDINLILTENPELTYAQVAESLNNNIKVSAPRMISQDMILAFLIKNNCFVTLRDSTNPIAQGFWHAISSGVKEFNLINGHPVGESQKTLLDLLVSVGAVNEDFKSEALGYANPVKPKYAGITEYEVMKELNPPSWKPATIPSGNAQIVTPEGDLVSPHNNGTFRFTITPSTSVSDVVKIRILAKAANEEAFKLQASYPIEARQIFEGPTVVSFKRPTGLSRYRHFKFEYLEPYDGALASVEVEGIA